MMIEIQIDLQIKWKLVRVEAVKILALAKIDHPMRDEFSHAEAGRPGDEAHDAAVNQRM